MSRRLKVLVAAAVLGVVGIGGVGLARASTQHVSNNQTIRLVLRGGTTTFVDTGKHGPSIGDRIVLNQGAFWASNPSKRAGRGIVTVTLVGGKGNQSQDQANLVLANGQLSVQGIQGGANTFRLAVTGGTGAYRNARGQVTVTLLSRNVSRVTVSLIG